MAKQRMRLFSFRPNQRHREFYVSEYYKILDNGAAEMTGKQHDITNDVLPYLVKAQRDILHMVREQAVEMGSINLEELLDMLDDEIASREVG